MANEKVRNWFSQIGAAEKKMERYRSRYRWKEFIEEFKGHYLLTENRTDIMINPLNYVFAYVKTEIPALALRDPYIKVNPKKRSSIESAKILEMAINYLWRHKKIKREVKKTITDGKIIGHGWFKTGYTGNFGTVEMDNGNVVENIMSEDFFAYRVPWDCIVFDVEAIDPPYDCAWVAHKVWLPLEDVKNNPRYNNREKIQSSLRHAPGEYDTADAQSENVVPMACLIEVWDKKNGVVFTVSEGVDEYIEEPKAWPYEMRGFPFSYLNFNPVNDEPYGLPDVYMFEPQILEIMKIRAMQLDHIKRYNRQLITTKGNFDETEKSKLMLGITANVLEAIDPTKIVPLPYPPVAQDAYAIEERLKEDMINISGQSPQERGATQKTSTRTFKELAMIQRGAENRRSESIDMVEDFVEDIAYNLVSLLQQFADVPYYVQITGYKPEEVMQMLESRPSANGDESITTNRGFTFTREDIQGEFDLEVVAGSMAPLDQDLAMSTLTNILEMLPSIGVSPGGPLYAAIGRMIADRLQMPELIEAMKEEAAYQTQTREAMQEREDEATQFNVMKESTKTELNAQRIANKETETLLRAIEVMKNKKEEKEKEPA